MTDEIYIINTDYWAYWCEHGRLYKGKELVEKLQKQWTELCPNCDKHLEYIGHCQQRCINDGCGYHQSCSEGL